MRGAGTAGFGFLSAFITHCPLCSWQGSSGDRKGLQFCPWQQSWVWQAGQRAARPTSRCEVLPRGPALPQVVSATSPGQGAARGSPCTTQPRRGSCGQPGWRLCMACAGEEAGTLLPSFISPQHGGCLLSDVASQHAPSGGWWRSAARWEDVDSLMGRQLSTKQRKLEPSPLRMRTAELARREGAAGAGYALSRPALPRWCRPPCALQLPRQQVQSCLVRSLAAPGCGCRRGNVPPPRPSPTHHSPACSRRARESVRLSRSSPRPGCTVQAPLLMRQVCVEHRRKTRTVDKV